MSNGILNVLGNSGGGSGGGGGGSGTVTTVSVVTANGYSGSVANPTTTPAITIVDSTWSAGTTGTTNAPGVGGKIYFAAFTNGTTTTITLPGAPASGSKFYLCMIACNGTATLTFSGSVYRLGDTDTALTVFTPGPAGDHYITAEYINSLWFIRDTFSVPAVTKAVNQTTHGFSTKQAIWNNAGTWTLARADAIGTSYVDGVVSTVVDANNFVVTLEGQFTTTGLTGNVPYYLSDVTAGLLTTTSPTALTSFRVQVLSTGTTTEGYVEIGSPLSLARLTAADSSQIGISTAGAGYGGAVTQATSRTTGVTLNTLCGAITTNTTSLAAAGVASFTVTNSTVAITDVVLLSVRSGQTNKDSVFTVTAVAAGSFEITLKNTALGAETGAAIINFMVVKGTAS